MRLVLEQDCFDHRELYDLIKYLPPDAALWREQNQPSQQNGHREVIKTSDSDEIHQWFGEHIG